MIEGVVDSELLGYANLLSVSVEQLNLEQVKPCLLQSAFELKIKTKYNTKYV